MESKKPQNARIKIINFSREKSLKYFLKIKATKAKANKSKAKKI